MPANLSQLWSKSKSNGQTADQHQFSACEALIAEDTRQSNIGSNDEAMASPLLQSLTSSTCKTAVTRCQDSSMIFQPASMSSGSAPEHGVMGCTGIIMDNNPWPTKTHVQDDRMEDAHAG